MCVSSRLLLYMSPVASDMLPIAGDILPVASHLALATRPCYTNVGMCVINTALHPPACLGLCCGHHAQTATPPPPAFRFLPTVVPSPMVQCWVRGRIFCRPHSDICLIVIMMDVTSVSLARSLQVGRGVAAQPDRVSPNSSDELGAVGETLIISTPPAGSVLVRRTELIG